MKYLILIILALIILISQGVSANYACGKVSTNSEISPSWLDTIIYYPEKPNITTSCKISPAENKYCCDFDEIKSVTWAAGKKVTAEIFDTQTGIVGGPVSLITTSSGFDIFPEMQIKKAISLSIPKEKVLINQSSVLINITTNKNYKLAYVLYNSTEVVGQNIICLSCNHSTLQLTNLSKGQFVLNITAENDNPRKISETSRLYLLDYIEFNRELVCDHCIGGYAPAGENITLKVSLEASHEISGTFRDYFPATWQPIEEFSIAEYSETHNAIEWEISGKKIEKQYSLTSPSNYLPISYLFQSEFADKKGKEDTIRVFRLFKFPRFLYYPIRASKKQYSSQSIRYKISQTFPLIISPKEGIIEKVAIYPKEELKDVFAILDSKKAGFKLTSNIPNKKIEKIWIKFKVKDAKRIIITAPDKKKVTATKTASDSNYDFYEAEVFEKGNYQLDFG